MLESEADNSLMVSHEPSVLPSSIMMISWVQPSFSTTLLIHATSSGRDSFSFNSGTMMLISLEYSMSLLLVS